MFSTTTNWILQVFFFLVCNLVQSIMIFFMTFIFCMTDIHLLIFFLNLHFLWLFEVFLAETNVIKPMESVTKEIAIRNNKVFFQITIFTVIRNFHNKLQLFHSIFQNLKHRFYEVAFFQWLFCIINLWQVRSRCIRSRSFALFYINSDYSWENFMYINYVCIFLRRDCMTLKC